MDKRDFLKKSFISATGIISLPALANQVDKNIIETAYRLPKLKYSYDALEPFADGACLKKHHQEIHADYFEQFIHAINPLKRKPNNLKEIFKNDFDYTFDVIDSGSAFFNHRLLWNTLSPNGGGLPKRNLFKAINNRFGSFNSFKKAFASAAMSNPKGWTWLVLKNNKLEIISTPDNQNPLLSSISKEQQGIPLMTLDLWDHAYSGKKLEYINAYWDVLNWESVEKKFEKFSV